MRFRLGRLVTTRKVMTDIAKNEQFAIDVQESLKKYIVCDWGETHEDDKPLNDEAVVNRERILAAYETCLGRIWIITEWDRSVTTILYPDEY